MVPEATVPKGTDQGWGPVRLQWAGKQVGPEIASALVLLIALTLMGSLFWLWHRHRYASDHVPVVKVVQRPAETNTNGKEPTPPSPDGRQVSNRIIPEVPAPPPTKIPPQRSVGTETPTHSTPPQVVVFEAEPSMIERGSTATLKWEVTGDGSVSIDQGIGAVAQKGDRVVNPVETTSYVLSVVGSGGNTSMPVTLRVSPPPKPTIDSFQIEPPEIQSGAKAIVRWSVTGKADDVKINPGQSGLGATGEMLVSPAATMQYTLTAEGPGGVTSAQKILTVVPFPTPLISFEAKPASIALGQTTTLRWNVANAAKVNIEPGIGDENPTGVIVRKPLSNTTYVLRAIGAGGAAVKEQLVTVSGPAGATSGELVWTGTIHGTQLVTIDKDRADSGALSGSLPGVPCIVQPVDEKKVSFASTPQDINNYERLVFRVSGSGLVRVVIKWSLR